MLEVDNVSKKFGGLQALKNVTFNVEEGQIVGLIGPNGAGKTTLFNNISGSQIPTTGEVRFLGEKISALKSPEKICHIGIGRTFQVVKPFGNLSVFENVMAGAYCRTNVRKKAIKLTEEVIERTGLGRKTNNLARELTTQERKRLEVARVLATEPKLILFDEVMAGLTQHEVADFSKIIFKLREEGLTFLVVEHNMSAIMNISDKIVVLEYGEVIAQGNPEEVVNDPKVIDAYLGKDLAKEAD